MGGRGASSSETRTNSINSYYGERNKFVKQGKYIIDRSIADRKYEIVTNLDGYKYWEIGKTAPVGYIPLIKKEDGKTIIAMYKSEYADRFAERNKYLKNSINNNERNLARLQTQIKNYEAGKTKMSFSAYDNATANIQRLKDEIEVQKKLSKIF